MSETRKLAAILAADVAGYSRLTATDEERTIARLRGLRSDLIDPAISVHHGRVIKRTGDGILIEFRSVVDAVRCSIEVQNGMVERNVGLPPERQIQFRVGIHLGDVIEETDGDLMGDGINIASRLENICEPGAICLSEPAFWQVKSRLDLSVTDLGDKELKNIPEPLHVFSLEVGKPAQARLAEPQSTPKVAEPPRLSMVVLPFANLGGDPEQQYFVDGVTESLTTDLSRISGSFVIARNTAFTYKGKPIDVRQIGRELNVRYVLEGSVQRGANRLRVNVQLIDAETGNHLWAERFEKPLADLFDMQDEIVARLANQLGTQLIAAEARRAEKNPNPDSMDLYFQGAAVVRNSQTFESLVRARNLFERAVALDSNNVEALVGTAFVDWTIGGAAMDSDPQARYSSAEAVSGKALSLAPDHVMAHRVLAGVYNQTKRQSQAISECERALALDRNAPVHSALGLAKMTLGRPEETEAHILEGLRLSPRDSQAHVWMHLAGLSKLALGKDDEAVLWYRRSIELNRNFFLSHCFLAAALVGVGQLEEARASIKVALELNPVVSIALLRRVIRTACDAPAVLAHAERVFDNLRKIGMPEG